MRAVSALVNWGDAGTYNLLMMTGKPLSSAVTHCLTSELSFPICMLPCCVAPTVSLLQHSSRL